MFFSLHLLCFFDLVYSLMHYGDYSSNWRREPVTCGIDILLALLICLVQKRDKDSEYDERHKKDPTLTYKRAPDAILSVDSFMLHFLSTFCLSIPNVIYVATLDASGALFFLVHGLFQAGGTEDHIAWC